MAVTTLRPNATAKQVSIVGVGGGTTPHGSTSDNNNTTGMTGSVGNAYTWMDFGTTTIGATSRIRTTGIRAMVAHDGVDIGHYEYAQFRLRDPGAAGVASTFGPATQFKALNGQGVISQGPFTVSPAPNNGAWTQAILDRIQMEVKFLDSVGSGITLLTVREVYLDVDIVAQPVTSAVTVSNFTSTTKAQIDWTFTQAEYTQTTYQVVVYSAAQYGASGFIVGTSTATYDSGAVSSADTTHTMTADLQNNVTYRAYVRTAIDWPGPEGKLWWSDWVAMTSPAAQFTVAISPPPAPAIAVTLDTSVPGHKAIVRVSHTMNRVTENQSSLETDTSGWAATLNGTISRVTSWSAHGGASLQLSSSAAGTMKAEMSTRAPAEPGAAITAVLVARTVTTARSVRVNLRFYDVTGALLSTTTGTLVTDTAGVDTPAFVTGTVPANCYDIALEYEVQSTGAAAEQHRADMFGWWYGTAANAAAAKAAWSVGGFSTGATILLERHLPLRADGSRGTLANWLHAQIHSAGALIKNSDGFSKRQLTDTLRFLPLDRANPESPYNSSEGMQEWTIRTNAPGVSLLDVGYGVFWQPWDSNSPFLFASVPGMDMVFSYWAHSGTTGWTANFTITFTDNAGNVTGTVTSADTVLSTTSQKMSVTATPPAGTVWAYATINNKNSVIGVKGYFYSFRWTPTAYSGTAWPGQTNLFFPWETVRNLTGNTIPAELSGLNIVDHEIPGGRPVLYRARFLASTSSGFSVASDYSTPVMVYMPAPANTILGDPYQPENKMLAWRQEDTLTQAEDYTIFHPRGANGQPVKVSDWQGAYDGTLVMPVLNQLQRYKLEQLLPARGTPLMVKWQEGGCAYILITDRQFEELRNGGPYVVTANYLETVRP